MITKAPTISTNDCAPTLTAKLAPWMRQLLTSPTRANELLQQYGRPLHITTTSEFARNARDLLLPIQKYGLNGNLYFARKANKLPWFVSAAHEAGLGVDTASLCELRETLQLGVPPDKVIVTAVGKDNALISEAVKNGCLVVIDNEDELRLACSVTRSLNAICRMGLRFSGFQLQNRKVFSRFGFPVDSFAGLIETLSQNPLLRLELLHAHIDRYDPEERAAAAFHLVELVDQGRRHGHNISGIDLGGGILMRYLDSELQWYTFLAELLAAVKEQRTAFTFLKDGLGYHKAGDEILGQPDLYPAWNALSKERFISAVLTYTHAGEPLYKALADRKLNLFFEPGRALLDNTGVTAAAVTFRKRDTAGNLLIGLSMNRTNLRPFRAEFCCDPIMPTTELREEVTEAAFFVGNLCSESDLIFKRKIAIKHLPLPGDIVFFPNSSGYLAHHMEIGTHGDPLPKNVLVDSKTWEVKAFV